MTDRVTRANLDERVANLNRRMKDRGSDARYAIQGRNGYFGLDRYRASNGAMIDVVRTGTKGELGEFLHAMMVALDDARLTA